MEIAFRPVIEDDIEMLYGRLQDDDIGRWYGGGELSIGAYEEKMRLKMGSGDEFPYMIVLDGEPIGYIQCYDSRGAYPEMFELLGGEAWGVDMFLNIRDSRVQGIGSVALKEFVESIVIGKHNAPKVVIDPNKENIRARKAFQKAGFQDTGKIIGNDVVMEYVNQ